MRRLFPNFRMKGITSFLYHYKHYDFMASTYQGETASLNEEQALAVQTTVTDIEERMCAMMGVPIPSAGELIMENKRLSMIGDGILPSSLVPLWFVYSKLFPSLCPNFSQLLTTCICNAAVERVRRVGDRVKGSGKGKNKMRKEVSRVMSHTTQSVCFSFPHGSNTTSTPRSPSCIPPHPQACDSALSVNAARDRSFSRAKKCRQWRICWACRREQCTRAAPPGDRGGHC